MSGSLAPLDSVVAALAVHRPPSPTDDAPSNAPHREMAGARSPRSQASRARANGLRHERTVARLLQHLGCLVARAGQKVVRLAPGRFVALQADLFGCIDLVAGPPGQPPLFLQIGARSSHAASDKRRELERTFGPFLPPCANGFPPPFSVELWLWGWWPRAGYAYRREALVRPAGTDGPAWPLLGYVDARGLAYDPHGTPVGRLTMPEPFSPPRPTSEAALGNGAPTRSNLRSAVAAADDGQPTPPNPAARPRQGDLGLKRDGTNDHGLDCVAFAALTERKSNIATIAVEESAR